MSCGNCGGEHKKCMGCKLAWILIVIGGLNWGLVGLGGLIGTNLNVVNLIFGSIPWLESVIYLVVGLATLMKVLKLCKCCKGGTCDAPADGMAK